MRSIGAGLCEGYRPVGAAMKVRPWKPASVFVGVNRYVASSPVAFVGYLVPAV